jgi:hypothetical protein
LCVTQNASVIGSVGLIVLYSFTATWEWGGWVWNPEFEAIIIVVASVYFFLSQKTRKPRLKLD